MAQEIAGDIVQGVTLKYSTEGEEDVDRAAAKLQQFNENAKAAGGAAAEMASRASEGGPALGNLAERLDALGKVANEGQRQMADNFRVSYREVLRLAVGVAELGKRVGEMTPEQLAGYKEMNKTLKEMQERMVETRTEQMRMMNQMRLSASAGEIWQTVLGRIISMVGTIAIVMVAFKLLTDAVKFFFDALNRTSELRNLEVSLGALTGSSAVGVAALKELEKAAVRTWSTTKDLAEVYSTVFPIAMKAGFREADIPKLTETLAKFAVVAQSTPKEIAHAFDELVKGKPSDDNPITKYLRIDPKLVSSNQVTLSAVMAQIVAMSGEIEKMQEPSAVALKQIGDIIKNEIGEGFRVGMGSAKSFGETIKDTLGSPEMLRAFKDLAETIGAIVKFLTMKPPDWFTKLIEWKPPVTLVDIVKALLPGGETTGGGTGGGWAEQTPGAGSRFVAGGTGAAPAAGAWDFGTSAFGKATPAAKGFGDALNYVRDEEKKAGEQADQMVKDFERFTTELAKMTGGGKEAEFSLHVLASAFADVQTRMGDDAAMNVFRSQLSKALQDSVKFGRAIAADLLPYIQLLTDAIVKDLGGGMNLFTDLAEKNGARLKKIMSESGREMARSAQDYAKLIEEIAKQTEDILRGFNTQELRGNTFATAGTSQAQSMQAAADAELAAARERGADTKELGAIAEKWHIALSEGARDLMDAAQALDKAFIEPMADLFTAGVINGGRDFGAVAAQMFNDAVKRGMQGLTKILGDAVLVAFGGAPKLIDTTGLSGQDLADAQTQNAKSNKDAADNATKLGNQITSVIGAGVQAFNMIKSAQKGQQVSNVDVLMSTISFAAAGATFGWIGAVVGAVVGLALGLIAKNIAKSKLPYAQYGYDEKGNPYIKPEPGYEGAFMNLTQGDINKMTAEMRKSYDTAKADMISILLQFPIDIIAGLDLGFSQALVPSIAILAKNTEHWWSVIVTGLAGGWWSPAGGKTFLGPSSHLVTPGDLPAPGGSAQEGGGGLATFQQDWDNYVNNVVPTKISESFKPKLEFAFGAMGMTTKRFEAIWDQLAIMDPKDRVQILMDSATALVEWDRVVKGMANLTVGWKAGAEAAAFGYTGAGGQIVTSLPHFSATGMSTPGINQFTQSLIDSGEALGKYAIEVADMPLAQQAAAAKDLAKSIGTIFDNLVAYLNQIADISKSITEDLSGRVLEHNVGQASTPAKKIALLKAEYDKDIYMIQHALELGLSPQDIQSYESKAADLLDRIFGLDPSAKADKWWHEQIGLLGRYSQDALDALGQQAIDEVAGIIASMKPFVDYFTGSLQDLGDLINTLAGTPPPADRSGSRTGTTPPPYNYGTLPGEAQRPAGGAPGTRPAVAAPRVQNFTINVNGAGDPSAVANAVIERVRRNPSVLDPTY